MGFLEENQSAFVFVTLVLVLILVWQLFYVPMQVPKPKEGMLDQTAGVLGFQQWQSDRSVLGGVGQPYEGMARSSMSVGGFEPPVFNMTPYDPNEMNQQAEFDTGARDGLASSYKNTPGFARASENFSGGKFGESALLGSLGGR